MSNSSYDTMIMDGRDVQNYSNRSCVKCGEGFNLNDKLHVRGIKNKTIYYHKKCWEAMFH